jgi:hypothetical protein
MKGIAMHQIVRVEAAEGYRLKLRFGDGTEGMADLSGLVGKGIFEGWKDPACFAEVSVDPLTGAPAWPGGVDLCPDSLYESVTGGGGHSQKYENAESP